MASSNRQLHYEGEVYLRPTGRGIVLDDAPDQPCLDEWLEGWLAEAGFGHVMSGFSARVRIVVEAVLPEAT